MKGKNGLAVLMSIAMVFTMMLMMGQTAYAGEPAPDAINLVDETGQVEGMWGGQQSSVYFGHYKQSSDGRDGFNTDPIKWRVLSRDRDPGRLFLLSDMSLDSKKYNEDHLSITWRASVLRSWLNDTNSGDSFINTAFSEKERTAIAITDVDNPGYEPLGGHNTKDKIFLLSIDESTNEDYGFANVYTGSQTRKTVNTDYALSRGARSGTNGGGYWWLRSPGSEAGNQAATVLDDGAVYRLGYTVDDSGIAVRPAFNLDLTSAVFTSSARGGKPSATGANSLARPGENPSGEWKLTMKDRMHQDFKIASVKTYDGKTLYIKYTGAATGGNEYISAIIRTDDGKIKYYGKLAPASGDVGATVLVNIDGKMNAGDTLCVFNEQCNDDGEADFSSSLEEITIPQHEDEYDAINLVDEGGNVPGIIPSQGSSIYFGKYMQTSYDGARFDKKPVKWRVLWNDEEKGETLLLSDTSLDCKQYGGEFKSTTWENSLLRGWLNDDDAGSFLNTAFSGSEQAAIATTRVRNRKADDYTPNPARPTLDGGNDTDDRIFLLSILDVMNENYGFENNDGASVSREARNTEYMQAETNAKTERNGNGYWWLRSPGYGGEYAAIVAENGRIVEGGVEVERDIIAVRPAFNLDMGSTLLISSADIGKPHVISPDSLADPGKNGSGKWKMTVKDQPHQDFRVLSTTTCDNKIMNIKYSGAAKGDDEYITAVIRTGDGRVKSIGNIATADDESGAAKVNIDGKMDREDTLCILNRKCNEDYETDFSSPMQEITLPAELHDWDAGVVTTPATTRETGIKTCTCMGCGETRTETIPRLDKKANPLTVKGKTVKIRYSKLKKKNQTIKGAKAITITDPQGKVTYEKVSVTYTKAKSVKMSKKALKKYKSKAARKITINASTGKVTVKKGLKKGTYKVKAKVMAAGNADYDASPWKTVTFKVKVK